jgi:type VI secretion system protein VasJ
LKKIAAQLRAQKPENELAYRFNRMGAWIELNQAPPTPNQGKSLVPPPPPHIKAALETLVQSNDWLNLLNAAETHAGNIILWLDPHRYAATAMSALGALFMKAKEELLMQVAILLKRLPTLPSTQFNDGTPFADPATQMWIESEVLPIMAGDGGGGGAKAASVLDEPLAAARDLAVKGDLGKALSVVREAAAAAPTPAVRFEGKLALAQLCMGASQWAIARSQLEGLTYEISSHNLTVWDPKLCASVYGALYQAIKAMNDERRPKGAQAAAPRAPGAPPAVPPEEELAERQAFEMLCRLDPTEALKLSK